MKVCIINGSPRRNGNTAELLKPFRERLLRLGTEIDDIFLKDYKVGPCLGCYACQNVSGEYGCVQKDDAAHDSSISIFDVSQTSDSEVKILTVISSLRLVNE